MAYGIAFIAGAASGVFLTILFLLWFIHGERRREARHPEDYRSMPARGEIQ